MATIKSYTDINQSRELVKILSFESADMYYPIEGVLPKFGVTLSILNIPCWSLAALLGVLKDKNVFPDISSDRLQMWYCECWDSDGNYIAYTEADNPVDACVEMIIKLKEMNLL